MCHMNRREFVRAMMLAGGAVALASLAEACAPARPAPAGTQSPPAATASRTAVPRASDTPPPAPTTAPDPTASPALAAEALAAVVLIKTEDRAEGVRRAVKLAGTAGVAGRPVLLKPNFNSADAAPGSTHADALSALVEALYGLGAGRITVADRSGMGHTRAVMRQKGVFDLAAALDFDTVVLDELAADEWTVLQSGDHHWAQGFAVPKRLLDAECVVQTCNLKTHRFGGHFTLSLKNSVGLAAKTVDGRYDYMRELHGSRYQRQMIAEINTAYTPALVVMDGVEAFVTGGPDRGKTVKPGVVLAGTDRVALDAVGVALLRLYGTTPEVSRGAVFEQEQIARAAELGLGAASPDQIRLVADDAEGEALAETLMGVLVGA